jgi:hypothetical protein
MDPHPKKKKEKREKKKQNPSSEYEIPENSSGRKKKC